MKKSFTLFLALVLLVLSSWAQTPFNNPNYTYTKIWSSSNIDVRWSDYNASAGKITWRDGGMNGYVADFNPATAAISNIVQFSTGGVYESSFSADGLSIFYQNVSSTTSLAVTGGTVQAYPCYRYNIATATSTTVFDISTIPAATIEALTGYVGNEFGFYLSQGGTNDDLLMCFRATDGQMEISRYNISTKTFTNLTGSAQAEYDGQYFGTDNSKMLYWTESYPTHANRGIAILSGGVETVLGSVSEPQMYLGTRWGKDQSHVIAVKGTAFTNTDLVMFTYSGGSWSASPEDLTGAAWSSTNGGIYPGASTGNGFLFGVRNATTNNGLWFAQEKPVLNVNSGLMYSTIQAAVIAANPGETIKVYPGTYNTGSYIIANKQGLQIIGVDASGNPITSADNVLATVGPLTGGEASMVFHVTANDVTITGLKIADLNNKAMTINGDNFTLTNCLFANQWDLSGSIYFYDATPGIKSDVNKSIQKTFTITGNIIKGWGVAITDGTGYGWPASGRVISNNTFGTSSLYPGNSFYSIGFRSVNSSGWCNSPVGGATITGNNFADLGTRGYVWFDGTVPVEGLDFAFIMANNTFAKGAVMAFDPTTGAARIQLASDPNYGATKPNLVILKNVITNEIAKAQAGDLISVAPGTYTEAGQIVVNKNLTITGDDKTTTIIKTNQSTTGSGDGRGWFLVNAGTTFNLSKVTLDGVGYDVAQGIRSLGTTHVDNCIFNRMIYPGYLGMALAFNGNGGSVSNSQFTNIGRIGVISSLSNTVSVTDNIFTGRGIGDHLDYAIVLNGGATGTITGNTISACKGQTPKPGSWTSSAIMITTGYGSGTNANISNNTIYDCTFGISASGHATYGEPIVTMTNNDLTDFTYSYTESETYAHYEPMAIDAYETTPVTATCNWFGTTVPADIAAKITGHVIYSPYNVSDGGPCAGGLPVVVTRGDPAVIISGHSTIQAGVNAAIAGDVVTIAAGTYYEEVLISGKTNLTLTGAGEGSTIIAPVRAFALNNSGISLYNSNSITIQNLTIDGFANAGLATGVAHFKDGIHFGNNASPESNVGGNSCIFTHVTIQNVDRRGISVFPETLTNNQITYCTINNVTGVNNGQGYAQGVQFSGSGLIEHCNISNVTGALLGNCNVIGGTLSIQDNVITGLTGLTGTPFDIGINFWCKQSNVITVKNNSITANVDDNTGIYVVRGGDGSEISYNTLNLTGNGGLGIETGWENTWGFPIHHNTITMGKGGAGIVITGAGSDADPMLIYNNTLTNVGSDDLFTNDYTGYSEREVGLLLSGHQYTSRTRDANYAFNGSVYNNTIDGFKDGIVLASQVYASGGFKDVEIKYSDKNSITNFEVAARYGYVSNTSPYPFTEIASNNANYTQQDLTMNYWGAASPDFATIIDGKINYCPYYTNAIQTIQGPVLNTNTGLGYCTIQAAIDAATTLDGHVITVAAGTYTEQVLIQKSLTLTGAGIGNSVIKTPATRTLSLSHNGSTWDYLVAAYPASGSINVHIEGFTIDALNTNNITGTRLAGVFMRDVAGTGAGLYSSRIYNFGTIEYKNYGIVVVGNSNPIIIDNNTIENYTRDGIVINGDNGPLADPNAIVSNNTVLGNATCLNGIDFAYGAIGTISGNHISGNTRSAPWAGGAILLTNSDGVNINGANIIDECWDGIFIGNASSTDVSGNTMTNIYDMAIALDNASNSTVNDNIINNCKASLNCGINVVNNATNNAIGSSGHGNNISLLTSGTGNLRCINIANSIGSGNTTLSYNTFNGGKHALWQDGGTTGTTNVNHNTIGSTTSPAVAGLYFDSGLLDIKSNTLTLAGTVNQGIFINNGCSTGSVIGGNDPAFGNTISMAASGSGNLYGIQIGGADVVKNFTIKNNSITGGQRGVQVDGPQSNSGGTFTISNNTISNTSFGGIVSYNKRNLVISTNILTNNARPIELFFAVSADINHNGINGATFSAINIGSQLTGTPKNISYNTIHNISPANGGDGIDLANINNFAVAFQNSGFTISYNEIYGLPGVFSAAMWLDVANSTISYNNIHDNSQGIMLQDATGNTIEYNTIANCQGAGTGAVGGGLILYGTDRNNTNPGTVYGCKNNTIRYNTITTGNDIGIHITDLSDANTFTNNFITGNVIGVQLKNKSGREPGSGNVFQNNNLSGNSGDAIITPVASVSATCNWWGTTVPDDVFNQTDGDVIYIPYLIDGADSDGSTAGFQPISGSCVGEPLTLSSSYVDVLCHGNNTGSINLTVNTGVSTFGYLWSNSATTQDISSLIAGTYSVTVTDAVGSTATTSVVITQPLAALAVTFNTQTDVLCYGLSTGAINVTTTGGTGSYAYEWKKDASTYASTEDLATLSAGVYTLTVIDANSCSAVLSSAVTITQPAAALAVTFNNQTDVLCYGLSTGAINVTTTGGTTNYTYAWTKGASSYATTEDLATLGAGVYNLTVSDANSCTAVLSPAVTIAQPSAALAVTLDGKTDITCYGQSTGAINVTASGGTTAYSYLWSNAATTEDLATLAPGDYTLTVTDANSCAVVLPTVTITQPNISAGWVRNMTKVDQPYYCSIQSAIDAADPNDVIHVGAGIYAESLAIGKSLTILGPNATQTPNSGTRAIEAILTPTTGADAITASAGGIIVVFKGFKLDMSSAASTSQMFYSATSNSTWTFEHNIYTGFHGEGYAQWWISGSHTNFNFNLWDCYFTGNANSNGILMDAPNYTPHVSILDNVWLDNFGYALNLNSVHGSISGNTVTNTTVPASDYSGGFILASPNTDVVIQNNTFEKLNRPGILIYPSTSFAGTLTITGNLFKNISSGGRGAFYVGTGSTISSVTVINNVFTNNDIDIKNYVAPYVNAINNYFNPCPIISGNATYFPYYSTISGTPGSYTFGGSITNIKAYVTSSLICAGSTTTVYAANGSAFTWVNNTLSTSLGSGASKVVSPTSGTTEYIVTGSDLNACAGNKDTVSVTVNVAPTVSISGTTTIALGSSTTLTASVASGTATYAWNTGATTAAITVYPTSTTTYYVTGTLGVCTGTASKSVTVANIDAGPNQFICEGSSANLIATSSGIPSVSYAWSNGAGSNATATVSPSTTTTYVVTATGGGNTYTDQVTIFVNLKPVANAGADKVIPSAGTSVALSGSATSGTAPYSYLWTASNGGNIVSGASTATPAVNQAGTYTLTVTDYVGCVSLTDVALVTVAASGTVTFSGNVSYYLNTTNKEMHNVTVTLKQGANVMYTGVTPSTGLGTFSIPGVAAGTYTVYFSLATAWGGVTAADINLIQKHYTTPVAPASLLVGIKRLAADVIPTSFGKSGTDAYVVSDDRDLINVKRITPGAGTFGNFATGNWVFTKEGDVLQNPTPPSLTYTYIYANSGGVSNISITVGSSNVTQNFKSLCYGDVDASYTGMKMMEDGSTLDVTATNGLGVINFPNPFSDRTSIQFTAPVEGKATVDIYNLFGVKVATLVDPDTYEGVHTINYEASGIASGIYMYYVTLKTSDDVFVQTGKMVVAK